MQEIKVLSAGLTDRGIVRQENQDQFLIAEMTHGMVATAGSIGLAEPSRLAGNGIGHLFFVADGMGGHAAGKEASAMAIQHFVNELLNRRETIPAMSDTQSTELVSMLRDILLEAHSAIRIKSNTDSGMEGMGTTLTVAYVLWPHLYVVHAGDTRCYLMRGSQLQLLTRDHTVANQMLQDGRLDAKSAERSPWSNVLVNALGAGANEVFADVQRFTLLDGDTLFLCSDGINKHMNDDEIQLKLLSSKSCESACHELIELAKERGGSDNITSIVVRFRPEHHAGTVSKTLAWDNAPVRTAYESVIAEAERETVDHAPIDEDIEDSKDTADFPVPKLRTPGEQPTLDFPPPAS
jgi:PPM family protein phosphatase